MRTIGHFVGGREVKGTSGRFADVYEPMTGEVQGAGGVGVNHGTACGGGERQGRPAGLGGDQPAAPCSCHDEASNWCSATTTTADILAREHGKTVPDAKGDIQRGLEVVEFACGIPHLMKGEYTEGAGPGIDIYSMRQALGVVAGITPFNFLR